MDPDIALQELLEALDADDYTEASDKADALYHWLRKGGFTPRFDGNTYSEREILMLLCALVVECEDLRLQLALESDELTGGDGG